MGLLVIESSRNVQFAGESSYLRYMGSGVRVLSKEQPRPPPRVQHLLDRLNTLDATGVRSRNRRLRGLWTSTLEGTKKLIEEMQAQKAALHPELIGVVRMEELDRRKQEALVAVSLCTGTLIACFSIALALL
jgi:hypothetical protein